MTRVRQLLSQRGKPLLAVAVQHHNTAFAELAAAVGFDVLWIQMEHSYITFAQAADLCRVAQGMGMLAMIRIPNAERQNVLRAAECGPDIIDVPMVNSAATAAELVRHALYAPEGRRGHFGGSRATRYGLYDDVLAERRRVNERLCLMAQIETPEAVEQAEDICAVDGIDAIFIGRGDLSASMGHVGQLDHPEVNAAVEKVIGVALDHGKLVGVPAAPEEAQAWAERGAHLISCGSDVGFMKRAAQLAIQAARSRSSTAPEA